MNDCMGEQIHLWGGSQSHPDSGSLLLPSPLVFLLPFPDGGLQGAAVDGKDPSLGSAATPETRLAHYLPALCFSTLCFSPRHPSTLLPQHL